MPEPPKEHVDLVYLCFPNNPTGAVASRAQLARWIDYAREHEALLFFDAAYEAYISEADIPHSIFEVPGARECAIELRSFSKNGGFTGVRCGFTVMPKSVLARTENGGRLPLHPLWQRRWSTKSNSVSYPVQRGAEALYSPEGRKAGARADRPLHGQRKTPSRRRGRCWAGGFWRCKRAVHLGENAGWPYELADVRSNVARAKCGHHAGCRLWRARRRSTSAFRHSTADENAEEVARRLKRAPLICCKRREFRRGNTVIQHPCRCCRRRVECAEFFRGPPRVPDRKQNLPQLYRFCFLMLGDSRKAQEVFHTTLREATLRAAQGQLPKEPFWLFRDARWRCLAGNQS